MPNWPDLYGALSRIVETGRAAEATRVEFERWCLHAEGASMGAIHLEATKRAKSVVSEIGLHFVIHYPAASPWLPQRRDLRFRVLNIACRGNEVSIYSTRARGAVPHIHLAHVRTSHCSAGCPVVVSLPGCRVSRSVNGGFELIDVAAGADGHARIEPEVLVFRAFRLIVHALDALS